ncbi:hypothetical protein KVR01_008282 [Diaporthe batatas]|uniref:uncharacterized protein n=1 Tax=Diaporthe batatas TaxID=748121 RepID=UPI001D046A4C|nr:uncharacterized protein KVR01_008282 [Diaporthe batatas]KAG8162517.1 hypothetical protein KVR01_008282 [Diaporthe batatas]
MASRSGRSQDQQDQQHDFSMGPYVARSAVSTARTWPGHGMNTQQTSSSVQGGARSEPLPPRPSSPAPSTVHPDDSASLHPSQTGPDTSSRNFNVANLKPAPRKFNVANLKPAPQRRKPSAGLQQGHSSFDGPAPTPSQYPGPAPIGYGFLMPYPGQNMPSTGNVGDYEPLPSQRSGPAPIGYGFLMPYPGQNIPSTGNVGDYEPLPSFYGRDAPNDGYNTGAPSTASSASRAPSDTTQSITMGSATGSEGTMSMAAVSQNHAVAPFAGAPLSPVGPQLPQGISIGVPPGTQVNFHYYPTDNRQVHIHNNAPGRAVTNNNQWYATDNSTNAENVGNTHRVVSQHATAGRESAYGVHWSGQ